MGKTSVPVFITVSALSLSLTWVMSPAIGRRLPASARQSIVRLVRACIGRGAPADALVRESDSAVGALDEDSPSKNDISPSSRGVAKESPQRASWAVLRKNITVKSAKDEMLNLKGGRFFQIERRVKDVNGLKLVCLSIDSNSFTRATIPADSVTCLTGSPGDLSKSQQESLRRYYELIACAEDRKMELLRKAAQKDPYLDAAAEALAAFRRKSAEVQRKADRDIEANHKATYELSRLRTKYEELSRKHMEWKKEHAADFPPPEQDKVYRSILERAQTLSEVISGLTI